MRFRVFIIIAVLLAGVAIFGGYRYWFYEEPRAMGALAQELIESFNPDERQQILNEVVNAHIDPDASLSDRLALFEQNGFDCVIRPTLVAGSTELSCRRPIEGRRYCDRINYYAYQTEAGEILESMASIYRVETSDLVFGRCPYAPPSLRE